MSLVRGIRHFGAKTYVDFGLDFVENACLWSVLLEVDHPRSLVRIAVEEISENKSALVRVSRKKDATSSTKKDETLASETYLSSLEVILKIDEGESCRPI